MKLMTDGLDADLARGLYELPIDVSPTEGRPLIAEYAAGSKLAVYFDEKQVRIIYGSKPAFFKGIGLALAQETPCAIEGSAAFERLGVMLDCSRNGVLHLDGVKQIIRYLALMGYTYLMLYTEDTLEVKGYPYFGYRRGRYTRAEIQDIESYCGLFGLELIPCVQTLAHLNQALRWEAFAELRDVNDILLIGEEKTYALLEALIRTCSENFSSRRIHIGMDEAHMVGLGRYLDQHGYRDRFAILTEHLGRVTDICQQYGLSPMMWSDMFFHLAYGNYFETKNDPFDPSGLAIPANLSLVYWDYYSQDKTHYDALFERHAAFNREIVFAAGAWCWYGFAPNNAFSIGAARAALPSAKEHGVRDVFVTCWGDDGAECSPLAVLPSLMAYSSFMYGQTNGSDPFKAITGIAYDDFMRLDNPLKPNEKVPKDVFYATKYIFYQDLLSGLFDLHVEASQSETICRNTADQIQSLLAHCPAAFLPLFTFTESFFRIVAQKCDLGNKIRRAYHKRDRNELEAIANAIPALIADIEKLHIQFCALWRQTRKPFGLEVQTMRFGGLLARLAVVRDTLLTYLSEGGAIPELEEDVLPYETEDQSGGYVTEHQWKNIVTGSVL
jgi:hypothetical protein